MSTIPHIQPLYNQRSRTSFRSNREGVGKVISLCTHQLIRKPISITNQTRQSTPNNTHTIIHNHLKHIHSRQRARKRPSSHKVQQASLRPRTNSNRHISHQHRPRTSHNTNRHHHIHTTTQLHHLALTAPFRPKPTKGKFPHQSSRIKRRSEGPGGQGRHRQEVGLIVTRGGSITATVTRTLYTTPIRESKYCRYNRLLIA